MFSWKTKVFQPKVISGKSLGIENTFTKLSLPKFEVKYEKALKPILKDLGFNLAGDFSGMSDSNVMVSEVLTKTFLKVDEEGSEGAAATGSVMQMMSLVTSKRHIKVDRTFILSIIHKESGLVVFAGMIDEITNGNPKGKIK